MYNLSTESPQELLATSVDKTTLDVIFMRTTSVCHGQVYGCMAITFGVHSSYL